jgi:hypothetical protein
VRLGTIRKGKGVDGSEALAAADAPIGADPLTHDAMMHARLSPRAQRPKSNLSWSCDRRKN